MHWAGRRGNGAPHRNALWNEHRLQPGGHLRNLKAAEFTVTLTGLGSSACGVPIGFQSRLCCSGDFVVLM